jgi:hypothetical protein
MSRPCSRHASLPRAICLVQALGYNHGMRTVAQNSRCIEHDGFVLGVVKLSDSNWYLFAKLSNREPWYCPLAEAANEEEARRLAWINFETEASRDICFQRSDLYEWIKRETPGWATAGIAEFARDGN